MRKMLICVAIAVFIVGCSGETGHDTKTDSTATASDTITNITNPGVGSASDDTLRKP